MTTENRHSNFRPDISPSEINPNTLPRIVIDKKTGIVIVNETPIQLAPQSKQFQVLCFLADSPNGRRAQELNSYNIAIQAGTQMTNLKKRVGNIITGERGRGYKLTGEIIIIDQEGNAQEPYQQQFPVDLKKRKKPKEHKPKQELPRKPIPEIAVFSKQELPKKTPFEYYCDAVSHMLTLFKNDELPNYPNNPFIIHRTIIDDYTVRRKILEGTKSYSEMQHAIVTMLSTTLTTLWEEAPENLDSITTASEKSAHAVIADLKKQGRTLEEITTHIHSHFVIGSGENDKFSGENGQLE